MDGIRASYTGHERVECGGEVYTGPNAEGDCARALIGAGADPTTPLGFYRDGVPQLWGTVSAFALRAWAGNGADPQFRRWKPHPKGSYAPLLLQWHAWAASNRLRGRVGGPDAQNPLVGVLGENA